MKMMNGGQSLEIGKLDGIGKMKADKGTNQDSNKEIADILVRFFHFVCLIKLLYISYLRKPSLKAKASVWLITLLHILPCAQAFAHKILHGYTVHPKP